MVSIMEIETIPAIMMIVGNVVGFLVCIWFAIGR